MQHSESAIAHVHRIIGEIDLKQVGNMGFLFSIVVWTHLGVCSSNDARSGERSQLLLEIHFTRDDQSGDIDLT